MVRPVVQEDLTSSVLALGHSGSSLFHANPVLRAWSRVRAASCPEIPRARAPQRENGYGYGFSCARISPPLCSSL